MPPVDYHRCHLHYAAVAAATTTYACNSDLFYRHK